MRPNEDVHEWIDGYLNGNLQGEALSVFTDKLESDEAFSTLVKNQKAANDIVLGNRLMQVKQMMDANFKAEDNKNTTGKWRLRGLLGTAVLVGSLFYLSHKTEPTKRSTDTNANAQQAVSNADSSDLHKEESVYIPQQQYKNNSTQMHAKIDTTAINPILSDMQTGSENNVFSETKKLNNIHQVAVDSVYVKNQLINPHTSTVKIDLCKGVIIEGILNVDAACLHKSDGEIHIIERSVKGGQSPYTYVLMSTSNDTLRQKATSFTSLSAGSYKLFFEDANNCTSAYKKPLFVNEKSCNTPAQSFSPHAGERFTYPVSDYQDADVIIYNRGGQLVYKAHVSKGESASWDGTNQNGQLLSVGVYIYIIEYQSRTKETGEVVIF